MEIHRKKIIFIKLGEIITVIAVLAAHLSYLLHTTFVDWPEMLVYPWFLTKNLLYYRDIVLAYVPGAYYILYALYSVLGFSVSSERIIAYLFIGMADVIIYFIVRNYTNKKWIAIASIVFYVFWQPAFSGNSIWYETILTPVYLGALSVYFSYIKNPDLQKTFILGLIFALASIIKQTAVWSILFVCLMVWFGDKNKRQGFINAVIIGILPVIINIAVWTFFAFMGAGKEYGYWVYGFLLDLTHANSYYIQLPARNEIIYILPSFLALIAITIINIRRKNIRALGLWSIALVAAGLPRWGIHRLQPVLAFSAIGFGLLIFEISKKTRKYIQIIMMVILVFIVIGSWRSIRLFINVRDKMQPQFFSETYQNLIDFDKRYINGRMYILGNYDYLYFGLDQRPMVLPWVPLYPWNAKVPGIQEHLIASIESQKIPYILYIPYHGSSGYYLDYYPSKLLLYVTSKYEKIDHLPIRGGEVYKRK